MNKKSVKQQKQQKPIAKTSKSDVFIWTLMVLLVIGAIVANYYFSEIAWALRFAGWIVLAAILVFLVSLTKQGKAMWVFIKDSRIEMRKVVWPKRQETVRTTAIVAVLVIAAALIMWAADSILFWLINLIT